MAYCYDSEAHRGFLLSRILNRPKRSSNHLKKKDAAFNNSLNVSSEVNDLLPQSAKQIIEQENGLSKLNSYLIKVCLLGYFLRDNNLLSTRIQHEEAKLDQWFFPFYSQHQRKEV
jgi:hypothetical protein